MNEPFLLILDAFCDRPFSGNPAAVCLMREPRDAVWMQKLAAEMNLSETAFVVDRGSGPLDLRWFTPALEVELCGHATLAAARAIWHTGLRSPDDPCVFRTRSGELIATAVDGEFVRLDFPVKIAAPEEPPDGLLDALGLRPEAVDYVGRNDFDYFLEAADESIVRSLAPDFARLRKLKARGIIVTAKASPASSDSCDFVSRFFAPAAGIDEDPVTGSAHCALAPYWCGRLGRDKLVGFQASRRGGSVRVELRGNRVLLEGRAIVVVSGSLSPAAWVTDNLPGNWEGVVSAS